MEYMQYIYARHNYISIYIAIYFIILIVSYILNVATYFNFIFKSL